MALSPKQQRFVAEFLVDLNGTQAAIRAGYSPRTARQMAAENLSKPDIAAALSAAQQARAQRTEIEADRVLREIAALAFLDPGQVLDFTGGPEGDGQPRLKSCAEIPEAARRTISSWKTRRYTEGKGEAAREVEITEVKFWSKVEALDRLCRHLGLYKPEALDLNVKGEIKVRLEDLAAADAELEEWERAHQPADQPAKP